MRKFYSVTPYAIFESLSRIKKFQKATWSTYLYCTVPFGQRSLFASKSNFVASRTKEPNLLNVRNPSFRSKFTVSSEKDKSNFVAYDKRNPIYSRCPSILVPIMVQYFVYWTMTFRNSPQALWLQGGNGGEKCNIFRRARTILSSTHLKVDIKI